MIMGALIKVLAAVETPQSRTVISNGRPSVWHRSGLSVVELTSHLVVDEEEEDWDQRSRRQPSYLVFLRSVRMLLLGEKFSVERPAKA